MGLHPVRVSSAGSQTRAGINGDVSAKHGNRRKWFGSRLTFYVKVDLVTAIIRPRQINPGL